MADVGYATMSVIPSAKGFGSKLGSEVSGPLGAAGKTAGGKAGSGFLSSAKGKITAGIAGVGAAAAAGLAKGFTAALAGEDMQARMQSQLGLSDAEAQRLGETSSSLYRDAWGDSIDDVGSAVAAVESTLGDALADHQIEPVTEKALAMAEAFEVDTARAVSSVGILLKSGLVDDATEAFDLLTAGMQEMPAGVRDELLEASDEYAKFFDDLGIGGEQAFSLLTTAAEEGMFGIDKTGDAIKEFSIRATDLSAASTDAFDAIGLDSQKMTNRLLEGGDSAQGAFQKIIDGLLGIEDPGKRAEAAIALFGTPLEDLGVNEIPNFLESLQDTEGGLGDVGGAADEVAENLAGTNSKKIEAFRRKALGKLADFVAGTVIPAIEGISEWAEDNPGKFKLIAGIIGGVLVGAFVAWAASAAAAAVATLAATWPVVLIGLAVVALAILIATHWDKIKRAISAVVDWFKGVPDVFRDVRDKVVEFFRKLPGRIRDALGELATKVKDFIWRWHPHAILFRFARDNIGKVRDWFQALPGRIIDWIGGLAGRVRDFIERWHPMAILLRFARDNVSNVAGWFRRLPGRIIDWITGLSKRVFKFVTEWHPVAVIWRFARNNVGRIRTWFRELPGKIVNWVGDLSGRLARNGRRLIGGFFNGVTDRITGVRDWFQDLPSKVLRWAGDLFSTGKDIAESLANGFIDGLNELIRLWNEFRLPSFTLPAQSTPFGQIGGGTVGGWGTKNIDFIPRLQAGGITTGDTIAQLHDQEAVIPLDRLDEMVDTSTPQEQRLVVDVTGGTDDLVNVIQGWFRTNEGGNIQVRAIG